MYRSALDAPAPRIATALHTLGFKAYNEAEGMEMVQRGLAITKW